jgi:uncharacterized membrane protein/mono/diheme cytochrome c family protein
MSEFIGRLHPLLVHLPIGFLVLLGIFEVLTRWPRWQNLVAAIRVILILTLPISLASIICGWLLASSGDYDGKTLLWHRWLGTSLGVACAALLALHWRGQVRTYRWALAGTLGLVVVVSHFGATLTHGSDFLSWPKDKSAAHPPGITGDLATQVFYAAVIEPIFKQSCVNCHGPDKAKGKLRLDTAAHLLTGGDSGSPIEPAGATRSLLGKRLALPLEVEEHMPPDGKRQLTANELTLVRWWLDAGAPTDKTVRELNPPPQILNILLTPTEPPVVIPSGNQ